MRAVQIKLGQKCHTLHITHLQLCLFPDCHGLYFFPMFLYYSSKINCALWTKDDSLCLHSFHDFNFLYDALTTTWQSLPVFCSTLSSLSGAHFCMVSIVTCSQGNLYCICNVDSPFSSSSFFKVKFAELREYWKNTTHLSYINRISSLKMLTLLYQWLQELDFPLNRCVSIFSLRQLKS